jgi:phospholipid-binding lipoprotein MlaA
MKFNVTLLIIPLITFDILSDEVNDPFENINRNIYVFNEKVDEIILRPSAIFYRNTTPKFLKKGISNFFDNINEIDNSFNQLLQGKPLKSFNDLSRFVINTSLGLGGLIDVASEFGLEEHDEDFGQTLAVWGFGEGPYLMLPFLGPSNGRDIFSRPVTSFFEGTFHMDNANVTISLTALDAIETREKLLQIESLISGDEYTFIKDSYSQSRTYEINDGLVEEDSFVDEMDDFLID